MSHSCKKLSIWGALPPYLGGKRRLCPIIFREIDRLLPRSLWAGLTFLDGFLGGGSVSLYAKAQGFRVEACDIAKRATTVGQALIANSRVTLNREDILRILAPTDDAACEIETKYAPRVFTKSQARFLDRAFRISILTADPSKAALIRLLAIRVMLLAHPLGKVRSGTIHRLESGEFENITESCLQQYVSGMRLTHPKKLWDLAQQINAGVFQGEGQVIQADILEALPGIQAEAAYFDPPYPATLGYESHYKVIDEILEGSSRPPSPFTSKTGASMVDALLEKAEHIPLWVLSLGNATLSVTDLEAKMHRFGRRTKSIALRYEHLAALATDEKRQNDQEFLVLGWNEELARGISQFQVRSIEGEIDGPVPSIHADMDPSSPQGPSSEAFFVNGLKQSQASLTEQIAPERRSPIPELQPSINDPGSSLIESGTDHRSKAGNTGLLPSEFHPVTPTERT
jgi:adenine-specific DNA methylase